MIRFWIIAEPAPHMDLQALEQAQTNALQQANAPPPTPNAPEAALPPQSVLEPLPVQQMPPLPLPPGQTLVEMDGVLLLIQAPVLLGIFAPAPPPQAPDPLAAAAASTGSASGATRSDAAS